ncbi:MAG TPA: DUF6629 family protein [Candidatus Paceibacterota bacterium]
MCFSAGASFVAGGSLAVIGGASLKVAKKEEKILAIFPLIFGIQQLLEGIQWLYLKQGNVCQVSGYGFLFFAYAFWPLYVPLAIYIFDKAKRKILIYPLIIGALVSGFFITLFFTNTLTITQEWRSIAYNLHAPIKAYVIVAYLLAVFIPLLTSSNKFLRWFGLTNIVLASMAAYLHIATFASVWCFFAADSSIVFFIYLKYQSKLKNIL